MRPPAGGGQLQKLRRAQSLLWRRGLASDLFRADVRDADAAHVAHATYATRVKREGFLCRTLQSHVR
jgi:hypothetical protein